MKRIFIPMMIALVCISMTSCKKDGTTDGFSGVHTPRTNPVPEELIGRWAIIGISGSTVYNVPAGTTYNTNEMFLGFQVNKDGTIKEDGYLATYQYGLSTWTKWSATGSVELDNGSIYFHRERGSYTSSRSAASKNFGSDEVYPNKSSVYVSYRLGTNSRGEKALFVTNAAGAEITYVRQ